MSATFQPNSTAFRAMAVGPEIRAAVGEIAKKAEATAKSLAEDFRITGNYIDSFLVTSDTVHLKTSFGAHDVAAGTLSNNASSTDVHGKVRYYAAAVEWGNKRDHRAHHVLGRTLASLGNSGGSTSLEALGRALGGGA